LTSPAFITATCAATPHGHSTSPSWSAGHHVKRCSTLANASERARRGNGCWLPVEDIVEDLSRFRGGWAGYFRYGNSAASFDTITLHAINRLASFVANHHRRDRRFGWLAVARQSPGRYGQIDPDGTIVAPRAFRPRHRAR
jgi:RNA-directed DNA polymerase